MQAGEAYFISDGKPVNNFEFFRPLVGKYVPNIRFFFTFPRQCEGLGYRYPELHLPLSLVFYTGYGTNRHGDL